MNDSHALAKRFFSLNILSVLCACLTLWIAVAPLSAQDVPLAVQEAADAGYRSLLDAIPAEAMSQFNFSSTDEIKQAELGEGFRVHTIPPELILGYDGKASVQELIRPTSMWFFPVISNGRVHTLVTVDIVGNEYRAVSIGASSLAQQWAGMQKVLVSNGEQEKIFVRVFQAAADYVVVSNAVGTKMAPLQAEMREALNAAGGQALHDPADIIPGLQGQVKRNIDAARIGE